MTPARQPQANENVLWQNFNALVNSLDISSEERASLFYWENEYRATHTSAPAPALKGELEYGTILKDGTDWRLRKFDAGMGETEYRIFKNEIFFAQFDNRHDADDVMGLLTIPDVKAAKAATEKENKRVLDELETFVRTNHSLNKQIGKRITLAKIISLRQQEPQQEGRHNPAPAPIGTCEHGKISGEKILCSLGKDCEYQTVGGEHIPLILCTREDAALALAEQEQRKETGAGK
jgi:hypothetical protein